MPIEIRDAVPADGATISDYNARMAEETEDKRLDPQVIGPGVAAVLEDATKGRYWVAIIDGEIAVIEEHHMGRVLAGNALANRAVAGVTVQGIVVGMGVHMVTAARMFM